MSDLFSYDRGRLDRCLFEWAREAYPRSSSLDEMSGGPGFSPILIRPDAADATQYGPITRELIALGYWLFVRFGDPVIALPRAHGFPKCVYTVRAAGACYLQITPGAGLDSPILVPFPRLERSMVGQGAGATFGQCRAALHTAALACTERVNMIWPIAVAIAAVSDNGVGP